MTDNSKSVPAEFMPGISSGTSTGAPGSTNGVANELNPSGFPTTELNTPSASAEAGSVSVPFGVGAHDGVEAAEVHGALPAGSTPNSTGAGNGTPSYMPNHPNAGN